MRATPPPKPEFHAVTESAAPLDTDPTEMAILNRVSWGTETADSQVLATSGLARYLDQQLSPSDDDGLPDDAKGQIAAMEISQKSVVAIMVEKKSPADGAEGERHARL